MENDRRRDPCQVLLRLWPEDMGNGEIEWRGKAQDIATGEFSFFRDWPGLIAVLQKMVQQPHPAPEEPGGRN